MAEEKVGIKLEVDGSQATKAVGNVRKELKEATVALQQAQAEFGEYSREALQAARRVAELRDRIGEASETAALFDPGKKFQVVANAVSAIGGAFSAAQGAIALFGVESEEVQKSLLKVQAALALTQGLSTIADSAKDFQRLKAVLSEISIVQKVSAVNSRLAAAAMGLFGNTVNTTSTAFKGLKTAIAATGIGLFVVALGSIVAYWDEIKGAISGITPLQKKLTEESQKNAQAEKDKLDAINEQDNTLRVQGKTEKEILEIKKQQTQEAITAQEVLIQTEKTNIRLQTEAAERNKSIAKGFLQFITFGINGLFKLYVGLANGVTSLINKLPGVDIDFKINNQVIDDVNDYLAGKLFNPEDTQKEGEATIKEAESTLRQLKNQRDGYILEQNKTDKKTKEDTKKSEEDAAKQLFELRRENDKNEQLATIKDADEKAKKQIEIDLKESLAQVDRLKLNDKIANALKAELKKKADLQIKEINQKQADDEAKLEAEYQKKVAEVRSEVQLNSIEDENIKAIESIKLKYKNQLDEITKQETETGKAQTELRNAILERQAQELAEKETDIRSKAAARELEYQQKQIDNEKLSFDIRRSFITESLNDLDNFYAQGLIKEDDYTKQKEALTNARIQLNEKEKQSQLDNLNAYGQVIGQVAQLLGKNTAAGKAAAIAEATINTYLSASKAFQAMSNIPPAPVFGVIAAGVATAAGIKNIREIAKVQVPNGGGGGGSVSTPSITAPQFSVPTSTAPIAPPRPQVAITQLDRTSMQGINVASTRAYVVESDITGAQERITRLNRAARLG